MNTRTVTVRAAHSDSYTVGRPHSRGMRNRALTFLSFGYGLLGLRLGLGNGLALCLRHLGFGLFGGLLFWFFCYYWLVSLHGLLSVKYF